MIAAALLLGMCAVLAATGAHAQPSLLPPACAHLNGEALDKCVRDIAVPQIVQKLEAVDPPPPDPAQPANCSRVLAADQDFCVGRNEIILTCRNIAKFPDFDACFHKFIANVKRPLTATCTREKPDRRAACAARNAVFAKCLEQPLGYFLCVANQGSAPSSAARP